MMRARGYAVKDMNMGVVTYGQGHEHEHGGAGIRSWAWGEGMCNTHGRVRRSEGAREEWGA